MMRRLLVARKRQDEGLALVVALVVTLLVFILTTAILADAFHNIVGSANARERLTAINAAEAGVSWYSRAIESGGLAALRGGSWSGSGNTFTYSSPAGAVRGIPGSGAFVVTATYYMSSSYVNATDALVACPACPTLQSVTDAAMPTKFRVQLESAGTAGSVTRKVVTVMELIPQRAGLTGAFAGIYICELGNRFTITGPTADVFLLASATAGSDCPDAHSSVDATDILAVTSGQFTTSGSVYALYGGVCLTNTTKIDGSLWAAGRIILGGPTNCSGGGSAASAPTCSSQSPASILICGDATSLTASPVIGSGSRVLGSAGQCLGCSLPALEFTQITLAQAAATFSGWGTGSSLTDLESLATTPASHTLFSVSSCAAPTSFSKDLYLKADIAIVSPCGFSFIRKVIVRASASPPPTLYLFTGYTASCATMHNTTMSQNFDASAIKLFLYNPCKLTFTNQVNITGQLLARTLYAQGQTTINAINVLGLTGNQPVPVSGFQSRVLNIREI